MDYVNDEYKYEVKRESYLHDIENLIIALLGKNSFTVSNDQIKIIQSERSNSYLSNNYIFNSF